MSGVVVILFAYILNYPLATYNIKVWSLGCLIFLINVVFWLMLHRLPEHHGRLRTKG